MAILSRILKVVSNNVISDSSIDIWKVIGVNQRFSYVDNIVIDKNRFSKFDWLRMRRKVKLVTLPKIVKNRVRKILAVQLNEAKDVVVEQASWGSQIRAKGRLVMLY